MVQYNKIIKNKKKGFTLVELMVVLAITAILAVLVGGGLIAYTRLARFEKNEANARTLFQTAQISLTRMETAGELDAFRRQVMEEGSTGDHFQNDVTVTDADGKTLVSRTKTELNQNVAALYYDRTGAAAGNHNALVERLLGDYIYDASLLNASICVEIDVQSGQVYSVFYDTKSDKLRFNQDGATNIYDRSYAHRRNDSLVGYYSAEDRVNVVQLVQTKLKVKNPRLTNGETLTLSWSGNSSLGDLDTSYTATAYAAGDTGENRKPLFTITIKRDAAGAADDNKQVITKMPVTIYTYDNAGQQTKTEKELYFPLSYNKGSFVLTLDAMADAALLRACENDADVAATSLYSITRLLNDPKDIYIAMRAEPRENYSDTYTASKEETTNEENTLLAKGGTAVTADLKYFRHLYNLRWSADWDITKEGTYTLTPQASNSTGLNWTGGGVTVYCAAGAWPPVAKVPSLNDPVAWPTIPELGEKNRTYEQNSGCYNPNDPCAHPQSAIEQQVRCKNRQGREGRAGRPLCRPYRREQGQNFLHHTARPGHSGQRQDRDRRRRCAAERKPAQADRDQIRHGAGEGRRELARCACRRRTLRRQHRHAEKLRPDPRHELLDECAGGRGAGV